MSTSSDAKTVLKIKEYFKLYVETSNMVKDINKLFGWKIITSFIFTLANSVDILNWYINGETIINPDLVELIITMTYAACIILSCNSTVKQGKHFIRTAYAMEECFGMNSIIRLELIEIAELAEHYLPRYSVLGLFDVDRSTIISLISILSTYISDATVLKIKEYFGLYVDISNMVKDVNRLFEWILMIIFVFALANSVDILNWYINGETIMNPDLLDLIITITYVACIILSCNSTINQGKHLIRTAYAMEECFGMHSNIRLELLEIAKLAEHYLPRYSLLGFFHINKSTVISLLSILSTYMLVVIQFNIS
ncbi:unnamed protein product [Psylliodes chrysocephalus]|uniref:Gustatory receptor n=1 Tax=Psylliodes chrysocephalus TaxID=3402493 RepID=A0A9P0CJU3_9CUCU|nr:unnamed protein product [Psylliodes chrysocephala]